MLNLTGKTILVLGAGQGIGRSAAEMLSAAGAHVCCLDQDPGRAARTAESVGGKAVAASVLEDGSLASAFREAAAWRGGLNGVIDIVGASRGAWIEDQTSDLIRQELDINLTHAFSVIRHAARHIERDGSMTFVGSVSGIMSLPRQTIYGAAKAGLHHLVAGAAAELGHRNIRVNAVAPGFIRTPRMLDRFTEAQWAEVAAEAPLQRVGEISEIVGVLVFLASSLASFVTGQTIVVDGGLTLPLKVMRNGSSGQLRGVR